MNWVLNSSISLRTGLTFTNALLSDLRDVMEFYFNESIIAVSYNKSKENSTETLMDFSTMYAFDISEKIRGNFGLSVWNILNRKNIINTYYTLVDNESVKVENPALPLTPNLSLRVYF